MNLYLNYSNRDTNIIICNYPLAIRCLEHHRMSDWVPVVLGLFKPANLVIVSATLPLGYALKPIL